MEENKILDNNRAGNVVAPLQSANTLFRFFKKLEYLEDVIEKSALLPRYYNEDVSYLNIPFKNLAYPMICFCDINFHKLEPHIEFYGEYGIAFSKSWGEINGVQPIQYINPNSNNCKDFSEAFNDILENSDKLADSKARCYLSTSIYYQKPIKGNMYRDEEIVERIFTDECEWRYIQNVRGLGFNQVFKDTSENILNFYSDVIASNKEFWLYFDYSDIKYIIVKNENDFKRLLEVIINKNLDQLTTYKLILKIRIWDEERWDY